MCVCRTEPTERAVALAGDAGRGGRLVVAVLWAAIALVPLQPTAAQAGWPLERASRVTLEFGAVYSASEGDSSQHRGIDIEAAAGERVIAPLPGRVSFAGSVPGVGGGRVVAVTIETACGKITLMPLEHAVVSRGAEVREGDGIGTLAGSGDGSSEREHLHVGAREGDLYVDPLGLIAPPPPAPTEGEGAGAGAGAGTGAPTGAGIAAGVTLAPVAGAGAATVTGHVKTTASGELSPGVSIAVRGSVPGGVAAAIPSVARANATGGLSATAAGMPQATVLTRDGVVIPVGAATTAPQTAGPRWISGLIARVRAAAERSARVAGMMLLGVMAALGALWPLWRGMGRKGSGKVLVSTVGEDVAAVPSR